MRYSLLVLLVICVSWGLLCAQDGSAGVEAPATEETSTADVDVPVAIIGSFNVMSKGQRFPRPHKVILKFGKPLYFDEYYGKPYDREILKIVTEKIMDEIKILMNSDTL